MQFLLVLSQCLIRLKDIQDHKDGNIPSDIEMFSVIMVVNFDPIINGEPVDLKVKEQAIPSAIKTGAHSKTEFEPIGQIISSWVMLKTQF